MSEKLDLLLKVREEERITWSGRHRPSIDDPCRVSPTAPGPDTGLGRRREDAPVGPARSSAAYSDNDVIAITVVWGVFSGPPRQRRFVEWDLLMNDIGPWDFGDAGLNPALMDIANVVTHELGHAAGLGHPPSERVRR